MLNSISDNLHCLFYLDESRPSGLRWKISRGTARAGALAGSLSKRDGYWRVFINGKSFLVHRVIASMLGLDCDDKVIDHKSGVRSHNATDNIRVVDPHLNARNAKLYDSNSSGVCGVKLTTTHSGKYRNWTAKVSYNNVDYSRSFSCAKYGDNEAFRLAQEWRDNTISDLNSTGAGFTTRHGTI